MLKGLKEFYSDKINRNGAIKFLLAIVPICTLSELMPQVDSKIVYGLLWILRMLLSVYVLGTFIGNERNNEREKQYETDFETRVVAAPTIRYYER